MRATANWVHVHSERTIENVMANTHRHTVWLCECETYDSQEQYIGRSYSYFSMCREREERSDKNIKRK